MNEKQVKKILVIEDDEVLGSVLKSKLEHYGHDVSVSLNGKDGLQKIREIMPDLILLDIIMPIMDGYQVLEAKKDDPVISAIPVMIVSNSGQPVEIDRARKLGARDFVIKANFEPEDVIKKVNVLLNTDGALDVKEKENGVGNALKDKRILVVEDEPFLSDIIQRKFVREGAESTHVTDAEMATEYLARELPDVILLDILLPGMNGFDFLEKLKKAERTKNIPIILFSNFNQKSDIEKGKELGAAKFIVKATSTPEEIVREVKSVFE